MQKKFTEVTKKLFHDMAITDLKLKNTPYANKQNGELTYNSILYLDIIHAYSGKYTASNIADMLCIARPSVTQKINQLEKMGYIIKKQSEKDKRVFYLYFNEESIDNEEKFFEKNLEDKIENKFNELYSQEEIEKFYDMLSLIGDIYLDEGKDNE